MMGIIFGAVVGGCTGFILCSVITIGKYKRFTDEITRLQNVIIGWSQ